MNMTKRSLVILIAITVLLAAALTYVGYIELPSQKQATSTFTPSASPETNVNASKIAPDELLGMKKIVVSSGVDALQRVKQSHTGSIEHIEDVAIVHYIKEDKFLTLWTTLYPNETITNNETEKMVGVCANGAAIGLLI